MLYWKPEQPPGRTPMRSARSSSPSWAMRVLTFSAALSVMLTVVPSTARGVEVVRVGQGEPAHRGLLHARGPGQEKYSLGGGQRWRVCHDALVRRQHVTQPACEVPVEVLGPAAGEQHPLGDRHGRHDQRRPKHEQRPRRNIVLPGAARGGILIGEVLVLLSRPLLRPVLRELALIRAVLGGLDPAGQRKLGPRGVGLHRVWHGEARRRVERIPADTGEVGLDPGVHVATPYQVFSPAHLFTRCGPVDDPRGHVHVAQEERHGGRELGTEAFLALTQELLYRLVGPAVAHVEVVGKATVVDQVLLDRARPVVWRRGFVSALYLIRRLADDGRSVFGKLEELLIHSRRVIAARATELRPGWLRDLREHLVGVTLFEGFVPRPRAVGVRSRP